MTMTMTTTMMVTTMTTNTTKCYWTQRPRRCSKGFTRINSLDAHSQDLRGPSSGAGMGGTILTEVYLKCHSELGDTATLITNAHDSRGHALASLPFLTLRTPASPLGTPLYLFPFSAVTNFQQCSDLIEPRFTLFGGQRS